MLVIPDIGPSPYHPQTSGKLERSHETLKPRLDLLLYTSSESLPGGPNGVHEPHHLRQSHEGLRNVTPSHVYVRREDILERRKEQEQATPARRFQ
jgi:hypothetical protein